jgi:hypothetical protein
MNEDYLWDKTGEADPEIERLERKLSALRFKRPAEPLPLPAATPPRYFFRLSLQRPALAAAAAVVMLLLAGGVWLALRQRANNADGNTLASDTAVITQPARQASVPQPPSGPQPAPSAYEGQEPQERQAALPRPLPRPRTHGRPSGARRLTARGQASPRREELARRGEEAKAQLIKALHIASDKLNEVQKKIRGGQEQGPIS